MKQIFPVHIACRGFQHNLPTHWIMDSIKQALRTGTARRSAYTLWPSGEPIMVSITEYHLNVWRRQYDEGIRLELPEDLLEDIDEILGVSRSFSTRSGEQTTDGGVAE